MYKARDVLALASLNQIFILYIYIYYIQYS